MTHLWKSSSQQNRAIPLKTYTITCFQEFKRSNLKSSYEWISRVKFCQLKQYLLRTWINIQNENPYGFASQNSLDFCLKQYATHQSGRQIYTHHQSQWVLLLFSVLPFLLDSSIALLIACPMRVELHCELRISTLFKKYKKRLIVLESSNTFSSQLKNIFSNFS